MHCSAESFLSVQWDIFSPRASIAFSISFIWNSTKNKLIVFLFYKDNFVAVGFIDGIIILYQISIIFSGKGSAILFLESVVEYLVTGQFRGT